MLEQSKPLEIYKIMNTEPLSIELEHQLIRSAKNGNTHDFDKLMAYYAPMVKQIICARVWDKSDHEDVFQEVSITVWRKISEIHVIGGNFCAWLKKVTNFTCNNHVRKKVRRHRLVPIVSYELPDVSGGLGFLSNGLNPADTLIVSETFSLEFDDLIPYILSFLKEEYDKEIVDAFFQHFIGGVKVNYLARKLSKPVNANTLSKRFERMKSKTRTFLIENNLYKPPES